MKVGSLCTGYGGLDMAVGGELAWVSEVDRDASAVLGLRHPGVPNLGDLTSVDWGGVEPVDVLTAGFPCQPVSTAGKRAGVDDERWLFDDIAEAVGRMVDRPRVLVFENVRGLLSANGGAAMARVVHGLAGRYAPAVARWERVVGRPAPDPVDDRGRLNPWLVEWMMGLPEGWVCGTDLSRTAQLRVLGNGVVPQQARLALWLLGVCRGVA